MWMRPPVRTLAGTRVRVRTRHLLAWGALISASAVLTSIAPLRVQAQHTAQTPDTGAQPEYRVYAQGLLVRSVYTTQDRVTVEIWDLLVGPGKASDRVTLPGSAVLEVRSGAGVMTLGQERRPMKLGATTIVAADTSFQLSNDSQDQAFVLRAVIVHN